MSFTLSARVRNRGTVASGTTTLRYYRSTDSKITTSDTQVGTDSVSGLAAFGASAQSIGVTVTAPDIPGTYYYYGACVDADSDETITTNNCSSSVKITVGVVPDNPPNQRYSWQDATTIVTWDPSAGATHYKVYYDDSRSPRCSFRRGELSGCEELAANVVGTSYTHTSSDTNRNYYWVTACNSAGCSDCDSDNSAALVETSSGGPIYAPTATPTPIPPSTPTPASVDTTPSAPTNVLYALEGSTIRVSWDTVAGADHYNIYHDDFFDSGCRLNRDGSTSLCEELATNVVGTTYVHAAPGSVDNHYWVAACNSGGCSEIDSEHPAAPIEPIPTVPANVRFSVEGSTIRVSWDPVAGADHYNIYHDDFFDSGCRLNRDGSTSLCEELATNVVGTTYVHAAPDERQNYYWVFTLDFEPSGNMRVTITDEEGEPSAWPGMPHLDLALGGQPILLPIPPSWSAAIAIETDFAPKDWNSLEDRIPTPRNPAISFRNHHL